MRIAVTKVVELDFVVDFIVDLMDLPVDLPVVALPAEDLPFEDLVVDLGLVVAPPCFVEVGT